MPRLRSAGARLAVVAACVLVTWLYLGRVSRAEDVPPARPLATLPMSFDGWVGFDEPRFSPDIEAVLGVDDYVTRSYQRVDALVYLYVGYHASQRQGDTMHSPLNCLPGAGWLPLEVGRTRLEVLGAPGAGLAPAEVEVNRVVIGKGLSRQLVYYWYQSHRRVVASEYWGKIYTVLDSVRDNRTDAALVRVVAPMPPGARVDDVEPGVRAFTAALFPELAPFLPE